MHGGMRQPLGEGKTFVTYTARIGAMPDDRRNRARLEADQPSTTVVPVEVSINEPIRADERRALGNDGRVLRVSTLETSWPRSCVPVSRAVFRDSELAERSRDDYEDLKDTIRGDFILFEEALGLLYGLIDELEIPKGWKSHPILIAAVHTRAALRAALGFLGSPSIRNKLLGHSEAF